VWFKNQLIAKTGYAEARLDASVDVKVLSQKGRIIRLAVTNSCDLNLDLARTGELGPENLILPAMDTTVVRVKVAKDAETVDLAYDVLNVLIGPKKPLGVKLAIPLEQ